MKAIVSVALLSAVLSSCRKGPSESSQAIGKEQTTKHEASQPFTNSVGMTMVWIKAGTFMMGSPASEVDRQGDGEQVEVTLSQPFYMGAHEVTQAQWTAVMGSNPSHSKGDKLPVEQVSWNDARDFCGKLTATERPAGKLPEGYFYDLPTEAQWEYACRAGTTTATAFGDSLSSTEANFNGEWPYGGAKKGPNLGKTVAVGSYQPNAWGLYDMHGNVWECCRDAWDGSNVLPGGTDPLGRESEYHVNRGGCWNDDGQTCRSACRRGFRPENRGNFLGFRVAAVPAR